MDREPFRIKYPLDILDLTRRVEFSDDTARDEIFKRNIYYYAYGQKRNPLIQVRSKSYSLLANEALRLVNKNHPSLEVLSTSIFGSALHSRSPADFDFLLIVKGNSFLYDESEIYTNHGGEPKRYQIGMSIKGVDNFTHGLHDSHLRFPIEEQMPIIHRTAVSLFHRHIPLIGYDFVDNKEAFMGNISAQVSDLLCNAYERFYLNQMNFDISEEKRSAKILSRIYEAASYLGFSSLARNEVEAMRKKIYSSSRGLLPFHQSKQLFDEVSALYSKSRINRC